MYKHAIVIAAAFVSAQAVSVNIESQLKTTTKQSEYLCAAADSALSVEPEVCCEYSLDGKTGTDSETVEQA